MFRWTSALTLVVLKTSLPTRPGHQCFLRQRPPGSSFITSFQSSSPCFFEAAWSAFSLLVPLYRLDSALTLASKPLVRWLFSGCWGYRLPLVPFSHSLYSSSPRSFSEVAHGVGRSVTAWKDLPASRSRSLCCIFPSPPIFGYSALFSQQTLRVYGSRFYSATSLPPPS